MTKTTGVSFRGKSFWVYDVVGGIFLYHLIEQAETYNLIAQEDWLKKNIENWRVAAVVTELAAYADDGWTDQQRDIVVELSSKSIEIIRARSNFTKADIDSWYICDDLKIFHRGLDLIPAESIAKFGEAYIALLNNRLPKPPSKKWWFYGTETSRQTIEMAVDYDDPDFHSRTR